MPSILDSGSTHMWFNKSFLPSSLTFNHDATSQSQTMAGVMEGTDALEVSEMMLPEIFKTQWLRDTTVRIFDTPCQYHAIIGWDLLNQMGLKFDFKLKHVAWDDSVIPMQHYSSPRKGEPHLYYDMVEEDLEDENDTVLTVDTYASSTSLTPIQEGYKSKNIKESLYESINLDAAIDQCDHLSQTQQEELLHLLSHFPQLFNGKLGTYTNEKVHLEVDPSHEPYHSWSYPVPCN